MPNTTDLDLTAKEITELASPDAIMSFLAKLGYDTSGRASLSPESVGLTGDSASAIKRIELLSEDPEKFLRVVFAQPKSLTAKIRNDLVRVLSRGNLDHMLVLASDFDNLEFVFIDKKKRQQKGPATSERIQIVPKTISVNRRSPTRLDVRTLRRFTWTCHDALEQYDKLRSVFDAAAYTGEYFQNRGLFSDYFLRDRLRDEPAWRDNPSTMFAFVRDLLRNAQVRWGGKDKDGNDKGAKDVLRSQLLEPLFKELGFKPVVNRPSKNSQTQPDYILKDKENGKLTAAFVYGWDRWLDGPDMNDADTPEENPGACVVTALDEGIAEWIIVTNGRLWRLYSRQAHARATNFYEVDLVEALTASGDTDPNEAFRYWWLFLRPAAFKLRAEGRGCWLDEILAGSREYAKRLGENLKTRIFEVVFKDIATGFLQDRKQRLGIKNEPTRQELDDIFEATLTFLYRLLFLLYAESRDLLPIRESPYQAASLKKVKEEIADKAGVAESEVADRLTKTYSVKEAAIYDRLGKLFKAMDEGDPILNVPTYNGGLFNTTPDQSERRDQRIARFLLEHKIPDRYLALAIDRLARDQDDRTMALVFIDYKSLEVRHLGSIYEGLLEFKLIVADEDKTTQADKKGERYISLAAAKPKRGKQVDIVVRKNDVYLSNDKSERKASGSYYTPDPIVEYIVANTVGPVLEEKLESLKTDFRKVRRTFDIELEKAEAYPSKEVKDGVMDHRQWAGLQTYNAHKDLVESLFDLRVLDPAMGSGHFLVEVVDYVTDQLLKFLNKFPKNPVNFALERTRQSILESLGKQGVTVDPAKLTDINLLKRHVLKRCVYGVDLNPMAVELAKVSLWLDAFTLGAPLNFLDHHLRCGNSLLGATFKDLEEATATLFALNYEPLLRAIQHVLFVSNMADATAAEVATSVSRYDQARQALAGYQVVLDLLLAEHFGLPWAKQIVEQGNHLDLSNREAFFNSLSDVPFRILAAKNSDGQEIRRSEREIVAEVEALAKRPDRRFFHWETEFPEVFFGFIDANERQIKHKDLLKAGSAGFDCVVGNPPYVRQEMLKAMKTYFSETFACYNAVADLFAYFYDRACGVIRQGGNVGFITSGSWMKANFGRPLRGLLAKRMKLHSVIDFGEWQPFPGAEMIRPSVVILQRGGSRTMARVFRFLTKGEPPADLSAAVSDSAEIDTSTLTESEWQLESNTLSSIYDKLLGNGTSLGAYTGGKILYGIKTGFNEAFVIDGDIRTKLIQEHPSSEQIIKPFLEGKDLRPWYVEAEDRWLIFTRQGTDIRLFPAIKRYLARFKEQLTPRISGSEASGRKPGSYDWFEIQDTVAYWEAFEQPKLVWPDISKLPRFSMDYGNYFLGNTGYVIPLEDYYLLGVLASWPMWFMISRICQPLRLRAGRWQFRLIRQFMERLPIPKEAKAADRDAIARLAKRCNELGPECYRLECEVLKRIRNELISTDKKTPLALQQWWEHSFNDFREQVETFRRQKMGGPVAVSWEARLTKEKATRQVLRTQIEEAEAEMSERVARAFGLGQMEFKTVMEVVST